MVHAATRHWRKILSFALILMLGLAPVRFATAQDATAKNNTGDPKPAERMGSDFIPVDGMIAGMLSPAKTLASPTLSMYPTEVADAWCIENIGVALRRLESVKFVIAAPGPGVPMYAAIFKFDGKVDLNNLNPKLVGAALDVDGHPCREMNEQPGVVLHQLTPDTIVVASSNYLDSVIKTRGGQPSGPLAKYSAAMSHEGNATVLFAVEPVRPLITGLLQSQINQIPPPFVEFMELPELLDAILVRVDLQNKASGLKLVMLARDDASAEKVEQIVINGLDMARALTMAQVANEVGDDGAVPEAMRQYANRVADKIVTSVTPKREGRRLTIDTSLDFGMAAPMTLMSMLMPVIQSVRVPTPRTSTNNLKQIGLAMHNHHSAYRELPDSAIRDGAGKPLLSWRVKILPFVEEQALYQQFHLDEPWDSEHNIKLLEKMPAVYRHPLVKTDPGKTVYQVPIGDKFLFKPDAVTKFREVLDGLSNTIMAVETDADSAVEWTKPADWEVDLDNPFIGLRFDNNGMFNVLMADGAVIALSPEIGVETLNALLTRAGNEVLNLDR